MGVLLDWLVGRCIKRNNHGCVSLMEANDQKHERESTPPPGSPSVVYSTWYSPVISMRSVDADSNAGSSMVTIFSKSREASMSPFGIRQSSMDMDGEDANQKHCSSSSSSENVIAGMGKGKMKLPSAGINKRSSCISSCCCCIITSN